MFIRSNYLRDLSYEYLCTMYDLTTDEVGKTFAPALKCNLIGA